MLVDGLASSLARGQTSVQAYLPVNGLASALSRDQTWAQPCVLV